MFGRILSLLLHKGAGQIIVTVQANYAIGYCVTLSTNLAHQTSSQQASKEFLAFVYLHALIACIEILLHHVHTHTSAQPAAVYCLLEHKLFCDLTFHGFMMCHVSHSTLSTLVSKNADQSGRSSQHHYSHTYNMQDRLHDDI